MTMSDYKNSDGEWLMDGAAIRAEWALDDDYAARGAWDDDFYADYPEDEHGEDREDTDDDGNGWCYGCDKYGCDE